MKWLRKRIAQRVDRKMHDDRDYACRYWWGDRSGSLTARCPVCNPNIPVETKSLR